MPDSSNVFHGSENKIKYELMKNGYEEMGLLNITLAEEGLYEDTNCLERYEKTLSESE